MVIVNPIDSYEAKIKAEISNEAERARADKIIEYYASRGQIVPVNLFEEYYYMSGTKKANRGFFLDNTLKENIDRYLIPAVDAKWDGIFLMTGMEGSGKTTLASAVCKYIDPTFPGESIKEGKSKRHPERIVFTPEQFSEAVANSKPKQAIQFDEAILGLMAGDAGMGIQKMLMKEITLIRKKQLFIAFVIPSIFSMRMPIAAQRSRFLIHTHSPDGIKRGYFKFYNYPTKRQLYIKGKKDFNQDVIDPDFKGTFVDTEGLFYDHNEYDRKKEKAIRDLSMAGDKGNNENSKIYKITQQRNLMLSYLYAIIEGSQRGKDQLEHLILLHNKYAEVLGKHGEQLTPKRFNEEIQIIFGEYLKVSESALRDYLETANEYISKPLDPLGDGSE